MSPFLQNPLRGTSAPAMALVVFMSMTTTALAFAPGASFSHGLFGTSQKAVSSRPMLRSAARPGAALRMSGDEKSSGGVVVAPEGEVGEFFGVDKEGNPVTLTLAAKEKLYLDSVSAYHNDGKSLLGDEEYNQLRMDLEFEGSPVGLMSRDEVKFMVAANRYAEGKPIMSDEEFDDLRRALKAKGSSAVIHKVPTCRVETQKCKADLVPDDVKNLVLYMPAFGVVTIVWSELAYWANTLAGGSPSPVYSLAVNTPFIAVFTYIVTNYILFQNPMVTKTTCPRCNTEQNIYFGDILFVNQINGRKDDGTATTECINTACRAPLVASKEKMIVESDMETA
mmetsp:Transcript_53633/g.107479  ORF Transcript_53633/g.107479 Transcript_53633/m.107479 type:complete len:338 (+) Transcript_53633:41-1054(+)